MKKRFLDFFDPGVAADDDDDDDVAGIGAGADDLDDDLSWKTRMNQRKQTLTAAAIHPEPLTAEEREILRVGLKSRTTYAPVTHTIMFAAVARHEKPQQLPRHLRDAMASKEWPLWLEALHKELDGLVDVKVWEEVDRGVMPEGTTAVKTDSAFVHHQGRRHLQSSTRRARRFDREGAALSGGQVKHGVSGGGENDGFVCGGGRLGFEQD